jgi:hypothetical protein
MEVPPPCIAFSTVPELVRQVQFNRCSHIARGQTEAFLPLKLVGYRFSCARAVRRWISGAKGFAFECDRAKVAGWQTLAAQAETRSVFR